MTGSADAQHGTGRIDAASGTRHDDHAEHGAELLVGKHLLGHDEREGCDEDARVGRHLDARGLGDLLGRLADPGRVEAGAVEHHALHGVNLLAGEDVGTFAPQCGFETCGGLLLDDEHRLVGAQDGVVEGLARHDAVGRGSDVGGGIDHDWHVAGADPYRGVAAAVGGAHHGGAPGGHDDIDPSVGHQGVDERNRRLLDHLDAAVGRASGDSGLSHRMRGLGADSLGEGVGADDDRVARQQREHDLEEDSRHGVGRWSQRDNHTGRARHLDDTAVGVKDRRYVVVIAIGIPDAHGAGDVLELLVLSDTEAGLLDGRDSKLGGYSLARFGRGLRDATYGLDVVRREGQRGPLGAFDHGPTARDPRGLEGNVGEECGHDRPPIASR